MIAFFLRYNKIAIPAAWLLLALICYRLAFSRTLQAWQLNKELNSELVAATDVGSQPGYLLRKERNLGRIIQQYRTDSANFRSEVIVKAAMITARHETTISDVPAEQPAFQTPETAAVQLTFRGDFFHLLQTLRELEQANGIGILRSVNFSVPRNTDARATLSMSVWLQAIK